MSHYGLLGNYRFDEDADDIRGAALYGVGDEKLGKIDDVIFDHTTGDVSYVVVDTGGWLQSRKFIVPADRLRFSNKHADDFVADLTKERVEDFPPYDGTALESDSKWDDYRAQYRSKWETGPVMHRVETDRNITPTTQQMQGNRSSLRASDDPNQPVPPPRADDESVAAASASTGRIVPAGTDTVVIQNSAVGIGGRWDTFQARLRERRKEAAAQCSTCARGPAAVRGSESADTLKKAI